MSSTGTQPGTHHCKYRSVWNLLLCKAVVVEVILGVWICEACAACTNECRKVFEIQMNFRRGEWYFDIFDHIRFNILCSMVFVFILDTKEADVYTCNHFLVSERSCQIKRKISCMFLVLDLCSLVKIEMCLINCSMLCWLLANGWMNEFITHRSVWCSFVLPHFVGFKYIFVYLALLPSLEPLCSI